MVCADSLVRITVGLRQGNSIDFQRVEEENALSPSSGGVRSSSWAFFRARRSLRVGRIRKKKRSDTRESISDPVTFFFQICPEPYAIQIDLMKSSVLYHKLREVTRISSILANSAGARRLNFYKTSQIF